MNEEYGSMFVCSDCIADKIIAAEIERGGKVRKCTYCNKKNHVMKFVDLAERLDQLCRKIVRLGDQTFSFEGDSDRPSYGQEGECITSVICEILSCDENVAEDMLAYISEQEIPFELGGDESFYSADSNYVIEIEKDFSHSRKWEAFVKAVSLESRFFNSNASTILDDIIKPCLQHPDSKAVVTIEPGIANPIPFYRARVAYEQSDIAEILADPVRQLGAPPKNLRHAGRMNAAGIPVMYMAMERETSLAEVRPAIGSNVVIGEFLAHRPIRLLDLTELKSPYIDSYFRSDLSEFAGYRDFIESFQHILSKPIPPSREGTGYLPTQVLAEYLSNVIEPNFDGVIFRSSVVNHGKNVVMFAHAISIECDDPRFPTNPGLVSLDSPYPDDDVPDYLVKLPTARKSDRNTEAYFVIQTEKLKVHDVHGIKYTFLDCEVVLTEDNEEEPINTDF